MIKKIVVQIGKNREITLTKKEAKQLQQDLNEMFAPVNSLPWPIYVDRYVPPSSRRWDYVPIVYGSTSVTDGVFSSTDTVTTTSPSLLGYDN
jgi:hypothetical protein